MKSLRNFPIPAVWLTVCLCHVARAVTPSSPADPAEAQPALLAAQIEADWLGENAVRGVPAAWGGNVTPEEDAAGGCDGVINGRWGFHTALEENPWWQVDLRRVMLLDQVHVYNRCDETAARAVELIVLVSEDGEHFEPVYQHDGTPFYGHTDGKPLIVVLGGRKARFVRIQLPGLTCLHLDEVEVYEQTFYTDWNTGTMTDVTTQSSVCEHSTRSLPAHYSGPPMLPTTRPAEGYATATALERGLLLAADLRERGVDVTAEVETLKEVALRLKQPEEASEEVRKGLYLRVRRAVRRMSLANPILDFDDLLLVKRRHSSYSHMSDQYYGWFSRDGGGLYILEDFRSENAKLRPLTDALPPGDILRPDLSHDGRKVLFAYAKFHPGLCDEPNKLDKANVPEEAFYHLYEINLDGTGLRQLTRGKYDDFDGRYLPGGEIIFLSTRRGQHIQCGKASATATLEGTLPDGYVRCGGGPERPVAVYTLHRMEADGGNLRQISAFEEFEWTPSIDHDGRILYARWDYVDRSAQPYMSLWSTLPDGTQPQSVFGNYSQKPLSTFEPRSIPGSRKIVFTASSHHAVTGGSLVLLDPAKGDDGRNPITRLTPEVPFPEIEGWPSTFYANPYPLSEDYYL
ncbi:MAG: discoidin domain-containing protein, partial [Planctomycetota bacterium]